jgi:tetratricopeptide (TPR) repeat protein
VLKAQRDFVGARANYERALQIFETVLGRDHFNAGLCENNLGSLFEETGDLERSREYYERALTIVRKNLGEDHPSTRMVQANLDALAQRIGHE